MQCVFCSSRSVHYSVCAVFVLSAKISSHGSCRVHSLNVAHFNSELLVWLF
jgi:hypothetical protein